MKNTVLIADSNKTFVMYLGILLKRMGFQAVSARDGYEAMKLVEACRPDIVMADSGLPQFDALSAISELKDDPDGYSPSNIMLVGQSDGTVEERRLMLGSCELLTKPVTADGLHKAIQNCLFKPIGAVRRYIRANIGVKLTVYGQGGERELFTDSLSEGGAFIRTEAPPEIGDLVNVFMPCGDEECLFLTGRVIYTRSGEASTVESGPAGFAIEFADMTDKDRDALSDFVSRVMTDDLDEDDARGHIVLDQSVGSRSEIYNALRSYGSASDRLASA